MVEPRGQMGGGKLKMLNWRLEMAILGVIEEQMSLGQDDWTGKKGAAFCNPIRTMESQNELCGDNYD
ncbi:MAG: hypothetical protein OER56_17460 [Hyphomicrobiales bacterium]|nr:hypothetical protein [Hyphomicrobiales bacterium]